jgi:hypothetical protein
MYLIVGLNSNWDAYNTCCIYYKGEVQGEAVSGAREAYPRQDSVTGKARTEGLERLEHVKRVKLLKRPNFERGYCTMSDTSCARGSMREARRRTVAHRIRKRDDHVILGYTPQTIFGKFSRPDKPIASSTAALAHDPTSTNTLPRELEGIRQPMPGGPHVPNLLTVSPVQDCNPLSSTDPRPGPYPNNGDLSWRTNSFSIGIWVA